MNTMQKIDNILDDMMTEIHLARQSKEHEATVETWISRARNDAAYELKLLLADQIAAS
jgi:hypothetical protein